jgi:hypothetical protein
MVIIGCDFHARYQQIAMLDEGGWSSLARHPNRHLCFYGCGILAAGEDAGLDLPPSATTAKCSPQIIFGQVVLVLFQFCSCIQRCFRLSRVSFERD